MNLKQFKSVMEKAARAASDILVRNFNKKFKIGHKKDYSDLVTEIDKKSESKIIDVIHSHFPEHNIHSEECGNLQKDSEFVWIIDPIDGTINYAHSVPIFCISIALEIDKEIVLGYIINPISGEIFTAEKGAGAYINNKKIHVSRIKHLRDSLLVTGFPYNARNNSGKCINHFVNFIKYGLPVRRLGSAALDICYVACGRFDGFWEVSLNPWDVAAGVLILKEAGGKVTDFKKGKYSIYNKEILASNGLIHHEMSLVLQKAYK